MHIDGGCDYYWGLARKVSEINRTNTGSFGVSKAARGNKVPSTANRLKIRHSFRSALTHGFTPAYACVYLQFTLQVWAELNVGEPNPSQNIYAAVSPYFCPHAVAMQCG